MSITVKVERCRAGAKVRVEFSEMVVGVGALLLRYENERERGSVYSTLCTLLSKD